MVLCAGNNYDSVKVLDHHMAERLARRAAVLYVDPPISHLTPRKNPELAPSLSASRLRRVAAGFWRLTPVVAPLPLRAGMRPVTEWLVRRALSKAVISIGMDVRALISVWPRLDVFGSCDEQVSVWWAQDDYAAGAELMGEISERVAAGERARARASDLVIAASPDLASRFTRAGHDVELIPNGADPESFGAVEHAEPAPGVRLPSPVAVLVGQLNDRVEHGLLEAIADRGISLLLVGPCARGTRGWVEALAARPNVAWVGKQPFAALPSLLAHAQVGLVPYGDTAFNRASFPLKTLEYLAAGLPVVATGLPATRWLGAGPELITIADGARSFADAVARAVSTPLTDTVRETCRAFARSHSYDQRARELLVAINRRIQSDV